MPRAKPIHSFPFLSALLLHFPSSDCILPSSASLSFCLLRALDSQKQILVNRFLIHLPLRSDSLKDFIPLSPYPATPRAKETTSSLSTGKRPGRIESNGNCFKSYSRVLYLYPHTLRNLMLVESNLVHLFLRRKSLSR